jgi:hypothetical protein
MNNDKPPIEDVIKHYGIKFRSGRYPWGSGDEPYQHSGDFISRVKELQKEGKSEKDIADYMELSTSQLRVQLSLAKVDRRSNEVATAKGLREKGYSLNDIAQKMGYKNDSSVRALLDENVEARMLQAEKTANFLKEQIDKKGMIDVGVGIERELGLSKEKLKEALYILEMQGYNTFGGGLGQVTNKGQQTNMKVLCPPGTEHKEIFEAMKNGKINYITEYASHDGGDTFDKLARPSSLDSSRVGIRYAEEGGIHKDGVVEIRRGVEDLSLGESKYAQVRILVDGNKYLKGMAVYSDDKDMPEGVDILFNTNKKQGTPKEKVLKAAKTDKDGNVDPDNPFGALIKPGGQSYYIDKNGKRQLSPINKTREEGDWETWSDNLPAQFLSKQNHELIKKQLTLTATDRQAEFDEIMSLTNPTVKKVLLKSFSDDCDAAAIHLKAAALPRQKYQVIMPIVSMKDNEVYAPRYKDGEQVALVRYPHGGTFEIPILTVNNKNKEGQRIFGTTTSDIAGINSKVAERLSGADFDGDTVMVIPISNKVKIKSKPPLKDLEGFDPKLRYGHDSSEEIKTINPKTGKEEITIIYSRGDKKFKGMKATQLEMGKISNLITDMTLLGASDTELAKAVKHSMVVIDAAKHGLDYKQSEIDNDIATLKSRWQGRIEEDGRHHEGSATIISRSKSPTQVLKRKGTPYVNQKGKEWYDPNKPEGALIYKSVREEYTDKTGKTKTRMQESTKMADVDNAYDLISQARTPQELLYADYANKMKTLGNQARKAMVTAGKIEYSSTSKQTYINEVNSLLARNNIALKNAPKERMAMVLATSAINAKKLAYPDMTKSEIKKLSQTEMTKAREKVGAKREKIDISDIEWEAIQSGAISENVLLQILNNADIDNIRQRATPRTATTLSSAKVNKIKAMSSSGYTTSQIAEALGVSSSTISKYVKGKE